MNIWDFLVRWVGRDIAQLIFDYIYGGAYDLERVHISNDFMWYVYDIQYAVEESNGKGYYLRKAHPPIYVSSGFDVIKKWRTCKEISHKLRPKCMDSCIAAKMKNICNHMNYVNEFEFSGIFEEKSGE